MENIEEVVLVDEDNNVIGTMPKSNVHTASTPLHRAFSIFIFNAEKKLLVQQRSEEKKTWPLIWSNSCCGHPFINETNVEAIKRRVSYELGMDLKDEDIKEISPYRYSFSKDGIMENEICPLFMATTNEEPKSNAHEVKSWTWMPFGEFLKELDNNRQQYSPWCFEEANILQNSDIFKNFYRLNQ